MLSEAEKQVYRRCELEFLDGLEAALGLQVEQGNPQAIAAAQKIADSRARLLGPTVIRIKKN